LTLTLRSSLWLCVTEQTEWSSAAIIYLNSAALMSEARTQKLLHCCFILMFTG